MTMTPRTINEPDLHHITVGEARLALVRLFKGAGIDDETAEADAAWLLCEVTGLSRPELVLHKADTLNPPMSRRLERMAHQRAERRPLQYILGTQSFMGLDIRVDERAFIPRLDTERLAEAAVEEVKQRGGARLLELCAGSGCIAAAVCALAPVTSAVAVELRPDTARLARLNIKRHTQVCTVRTGDLYNALKKSDGLFDVIVSNPPYIPSAEIETLEPEVRCFEPQEALDGGIDGLLVYRSIISGAHAWLAPKGALLLEVGHTQAWAVAQIMAEHNFTDIHTYSDYGGNERVVAGRRSNI